MPREKHFTGLPVPSDEDKFWSLVDRRSLEDCWVWLGSIRPSGYGSVMFVWQGKSRNLYPHRVSVALSGREIPEGMVIDHQCRNRKCVNPHHLRVVSIAENTIENSIGTSALNSVKTVCMRGHPLSGEHVRIDKLGRRSCNTCRRQKYAEGTNPNRCKKGPK